MSEADELVKQAEALYLEAAFELTRLDKRMRRAVRLVLLERVSGAKAARRVGRSRNNVYRALAVVESKLKLVKEGK